MLPEPCVFCDIAAGKAPAVVVCEWPDAVAIVPRNPVTPGHLLIIPVAHVPDFADDPVVSATVMARAAEMAEGSHAFNLITSKGAAATQTVFHLHAHLVPRRAGDGLALPWPDRQEASRG